MECTRTNTLALFDVDGTLTHPRMRITPKMEEILEKLRVKIQVGIIGGSDMLKIKEQFNNSAIEENFDFVFSENGLMGFDHGRQLPSTVTSLFIIT
ncbi:hypothetical protein Zmor_016434 [Zophobas morio]|uniref:Phosphomannomutase n=1 Tax=Zophobas morio TaxID=2755281 RepID=A0AA38HKR6_9CUCU|nr:hypothetical protein Zmor_016434 [Zophobas morio]